MPRSRKGRRLTDQEKELWQRVAQTTKPLDRAPTSATPDKASKQNPKRDPAPKPKPAPVQQAKVPDPPTPALGMDQKTFTRMRRGKLQPEGRLDLHGMTQATAHSALTSFILRSQAEGKRLVLVITGKGKRASPETPGVLRRNVPHWLETPPLRQAVLQVTASHQKHGGGGALYVYLRRHKG